jgi:3,4-dihydroxy 2-butanone 4-phosphate synthase / GTP cyclohydrolase II
MEPQLPTDPPTPAARGVGLPDPGGMPREARVVADVPTIRLDPIERAIADIAAGKVVVVVDDEDRENEGDLILAAAKTTTEAMTFFVRHTSGVVCVPMEGPELDRLKLPPMTSVNEDRKQTAYAVSVDARDGINTGISAADRARTVRVLVDSATEPHELTRPGHVFPLRAVEGGVLRRVGHTEAAVDLARLARLTPAGVLAEVVNDDGSMARLPELRRFADEHRLALVSIADLVAYRMRTEALLQQVSQARLPTRYGEYRAIGYRSTIDPSEYVALVHGEIGAGVGVLVRLHPACLAGDVFGSLDCDCAAKLDAALRMVAAADSGVVLYMPRDGLGLMAPVTAQLFGTENGRQVVRGAEHHPLPPAGAKDFAVGARILADLGVDSVRLITDHPSDRVGLETQGSTVLEEVPTSVLVTLQD